MVALLHSCGIPITNIFLFVIERDHYNAPPPITLRESQQNMPPRSNYVSLKRPASTMSKSDSRESPASDKNEEQSVNKVCRV